MKIGFDISMLVYRGSGVATYTYNLVKNLLKYDKKNEYRFFYSSLRRPKNFYYLDELKELGGKVYSYRVPPRLLKLLWNKYHQLPIEWLVGKVDYFHSSDFLRPPLLRSTRGLTTVHDLTWKIYPQFHTKDIVKAHERKMQKTIQYGDIIIVDSHNTKNDLLKLYPNAKNKNKIYVIYPGVDEKFRPIKDKKRIAQILKKYGVSYPKRYLLYVGAIEPRKNLDTAIKVFSKLIKDKDYSDFEFLIVGRMGWKNEKIFGLIKNLGLKEKVKFVGFVEDSDLPFFYNAVELLIYLSKYEGFGLPPAEAAYCEKPVLLYNNSSFKEIFKDDYPYSQLGNELETLKHLITNRIEIKKNLKYNFSWQSYLHSFLNVIK